MMSLANGAARTPSDRPFPSIATAGLAAILVAAMMLPVLAAPTASAQTSTEEARILGVHLSTLGADEGYAVTFFSTQPLRDPRVDYKVGTSETGAIPSREVDKGPPTASTHTYVSHIPGATTAYTVSGVPDVTTVPPPTRISRTFTATPMPALDAERVRIAFVADQGRSTEAAAVIAAVEKAQPDVVLHGGDMTYSARGDGWDEWFGMVEPVASRVPWMPAVGNHDAYECQVGGTLPRLYEERCGIDEYRARFALPNEPAVGYTFDWGPVRILSLDTEAYHYQNRSKYAVDPPTDAREQEAYAAKVLAERPDAWTIAFFHRPAYSSANHRSDMGVRGHLSPVLEAGGVDLVLQGHDHSYERTWTMRDSTVMARGNTTIEGTGTVYVVGGGGGAQLYTNFSMPQPEWSAYREAVYEYVIIEATADRLDVKAMALDGRVVDAFIIIRAAPATPEGGVLDTPSPAVMLLVGLVVAAAVIGRRRIGIDRI